MIRTIAKENKRRDEEILGLPAERLGSLPQGKHVSYLRCAHTCLSPQWKIGLSRAHDSSRRCITSTKMHASAKYLEERASSERTRSEATPPSALLRQVSEANDGGAQRRPQLVNQSLH